MFHTFLSYIERLKYLLILRKPDEIFWDYNQVVQYDYNVVGGVSIFTLLRDSDQLPRTEISTCNGGSIFKIKKGF